MADTHIHIHLNGEQAVATQAPSVKKKAAPARRPKSGPDPKPKRKASAYSKRYGAAFKKVSSQYKTKKGGWKKGGFKAAQKAAHKLAKK
jgi:hypothetical protein